MDLSQPRMLKPQFCTKLWNLSSTAYTEAALGKYLFAASANRKNDSQQLITLSVYMRACECCMKIDWKKTSANPLNSREVLHPDFACLVLW